MKSNYFSLKQIIDNCENSKNKKIIFVSAHKGPLFFDEYI